MDTQKMSTELSEATMANEDVTSLEPGENYESDWDDDNISSGSITDSDDDENFVIDERHEDHWDKIYFRNPWASQWTADWFNTWLDKDEKSVANEDLYKNAITQLWMKAFASMRRDRISLLTKPRGPDSCIIPLFEDGNGWQYQIGLSITYISLPKIECPSTLRDGQLCSSSLFALARRIQVEPSPTAEGSPTPPKLAVPLGTLRIRGGRPRGPELGCMTEYTDYSVVVDVGHEDMPLWIVAPRAQLQKRLNNKFYFEPIKNLPMFDGLLQKEDDCEYDCACILSSIHRLGKPPPDPDAPSFQDTCEMIRKTRATVDPAAIRLPMERIQDFVGDEPVENAFQLIPFSDIGSQQDEAESKEESEGKEEAESKEKVEKKEDTESKEEMGEGGEESTTKPDEVDALGK